MNNLAMSHVPASDPVTTSPALEWLTAGDGHRIPCRHWPVASPRAVVHVVHGMAEHSGCYDDVAPLLNAAGLAVLAHDHRCHGIAVPEAELGNVSASQHWAAICHDMATVNAELHRRYPDLPVIVLGHSMGSFIAQDFAQHYPDQLNLLLLEGSNFEAPWFTTAASWLAGFEAWRQGPQGRSPLIHALSFGGFNKTINAARTAFDWISRDTRFVDRYVADPLCGFQLSNAYWQQFLKGLARLYTPASLKRLRPDMPVYLFAGSADPVGHMGSGVEKLARALRTAGCRDVTLRLYPEARHDLLHETNRDEVVTDLISWMKRLIP
ncbi:MAG: lysophospholipase [Moraxellaceae bacterium]|nr:lysophospholipase [Moraxellaceae bacterium]